MARIIEIYSEQHYEDELTKSAPSQLVVVDFFATWCRPCHDIAPVFAGLSEKFKHVKFLKVDVDRYPGVAAKYDVRAMPTFLFLKNRQKIDQIQGADQQKLESTIILCAGNSFELEASSENIGTGRTFPCFIDLIKNDTDTFVSAGGIILRFANNILKDRDNLKYRQINLCNNIFKNKLKPVLGAVECLNAMGFQEIDDKLLLEPACCLDDLHAIRDAILDEINKRTLRTKSSEAKPFNNVAEKKSTHLKVSPEQEKINNTTPAVCESPEIPSTSGDLHTNSNSQPTHCQRPELPSSNVVCDNERTDSNSDSGCDVLSGGATQPQAGSISQEQKQHPQLQQQPIVTSKSLRYVPKLNSQEKKTFYAKVVSQMKLIFLYDDEELQKLARSVMPLDNLEQEAKQDYQENPDKILSSERDYLLLRLLGWFKNDFFSWMNAPICDRCGGTTKFHSNDAPNFEEREWKSGGVECYQCHNCYIIIRFPRYNHPQKLLETRRGRCGEWANCFTLCCRAAGFEARYVLDWTDHVWTEVYSDQQRRWLHCDSCENVCDKPLLYESGWNKKLSYVIAFGKDEIVDVTWRYSSNHKDTISRRTLVPENWLFDLYMHATKEFQSIITDPSRKATLMSRQIVEMVEFITPKGKSKEEEQGRISGDLNWRQARGEAGDDPVIKKKYVFRPSAEHIVNQRMQIRYFPVKDCYYTSFGDPVLDDSSVIHGWNNGLESCENMFRKVESDWKMIYLARCEGADTGLIRWSIDVQNTNLVISHIDVKVSSQLYGTGTIDFKLHNEVNTVEFHDNVSSDDFFGSKSLYLSACLRGSTGDIAWQHAQLFRCAESDENFVGLEIDILFTE